MSRKRKANDCEGREELIAIATVSIDDALEFDPMTGRMKVKPLQKWGSRAKLGLNVETDCRGRLKSISTGDRIKAIQMLLDKGLI